MKYLVTGGAGFIGSHITKALVKRGDSVIVLDNLITGKEDNLELADFKWYQDIDGGHFKFIAWEDYNSKWISNSKSREYAHILRYKSQAILTTSKTIIKDNPRFTIRRKNIITKYPPLIILDNFLKIPINSKVLNSLTKRIIIIFTLKNNKKSKYLKKLGCEIIYIKNDIKSKLKLITIFTKLYNIGIRDILVEAGGILFSELIKHKLVDELHIFKSPIKIGDKGIPLLIKNSLKNLKLLKIDKKKFGNDDYSNYELKP